MALLSEFFLNLPVLTLSTTITGLQATPTISGTEPCLPNCPHFQPLSCPFHLFYSEQLKLLLFKNINQIMLCLSFQSSCSFPYNKNLKASPWLKKSCAIQSCHLFNDMSHCSLLIPTLASNKHSPKSDPQALLLLLARMLVPQIFICTLSS